MEALLSMEEASKILGISRVTLYRLIRDDKIKVIKIRRRTLLHPDEIREFIEAIREVRS